jgi:hypothetical protein
MDELYRAYTKVTPAIKEMILGNLARKWKHFMAIIDYN